MNWAKIKTEDEFWEAADIWYQRAHQLRVIWQNDEETDKRKIKSYILWHEMVKRVLRLSKIATKIQQPKYHNFEKGGMVSGGLEHGDGEYVINKNINR